MAVWSEFETREVRRLVLRTKRSVAGLRSGPYRSAFRGTGLEFRDVREYQAGDDLRSLDRNVSSALFEAASNSLA